MMPIWGSTVPNSASFYAHVCVSPALQSLGISADSHSMLVAFKTKLEKTQTQIMYYIWRLTARPNKAGDEMTSGSMNEVSLASGLRRRVGNETL